jgi:hypothetical protein
MPLDPIKSANVSKQEFTSLVETLNTEDLTRAELNLSNLEDLIEHFLPKYNPTEHTTLWWQIAKSSLPTLLKWHLTALSDDPTRKFFYASSGGYLMLAYLKDVVTDRVAEAKINTDASFKIKLNTIKFLIHLANLMHKNKVTTILASQFQADVDYDVDLIKVFAQDFIHCSDDNLQFVSNVFIDHLNSSSIFALSAAGSRFADRKKLLPEEDRKKYREARLKVFCEYLFSNYKNPLQINDSIKQTDKIRLSSFLIDLINPFKYIIGPKRARHSITMNSSLGEKIKNTFHFFFGKAPSGTYLWYGTFPGKPKIGLFDLVTLGFGVGSLYLSYIMFVFPGLKGLASAARYVLLVPVIAAALVLLAARFVFSAIFTLVSLPIVCVVHEIASFLREKQEQKALSLLAPGGEIYGTHASLIQSFNKYDIKPSPFEQGVLYVYDSKRVREKISFKGQEEKVDALYSLDIGKVATNTAEIEDNKVGLHVANNRLTG